MRGASTWQGLSRREFLTAALGTAGGLAASCMSPGAKPTMPEASASLGPAETAQVHALIRQLKSEGIGIFLVSHDIHDVFDLSERISVMYHGKLVGTVNKNDVTTDEVLGMIILGKPPTKLTQQELAELHG